MSGDQWERERDAQDRHLVHQLDALDGKPAAWRKFRQLVVNCRRCGDVVAEVIATEPYRCLVLNGLAPTAGLAAIARTSETDPLAAGRELYQWRKRNPRSIRTRGKTFLPLSLDDAAPDGEPPLDLVPSACRCCGQHLLDMRSISQALSARRAKLVVTPP